MEKRIVALFGSSGRGKTTALKAFIQELKNNSAFSFNGYVDEYNEKHPDIVALFVHIESGMVIGISTAGDVCSIIKNRVEELLIKEHKCEIVFTASRTKGETCGELNELANKYEYELSWIEKLYRTYDPIKKEIGIENNRHLDNITALEVNYLLDYLKYILK